MNILPTKLDGVFIIETKVFEDNRGVFVKTFHEETFKAFGLETKFTESFYSISKKNVVRGMHFHLPPKDHAKLVYVTCGSALDIILDIRKGSPTYGKHITVELSQENNKMLYIPVGCAHGFLSKEDATCMVYLQSGMHSPLHDSGIRLDSFDVELGNSKDIIISERDKKFVSLADFDSPFM